MIEPPKNSINNQITTASNKINRLENGINVIKGYLSKLNISSGVYRMINCNGEVLYIGKAYNLKKRVASYTRPMRMPIRLQRMVAETVSMDFITTHTEVEALLLENNLIKKLKPRYNVLLRDDKTFPDILIMDNQDYPQLIKHRGKHVVKGEYFGPFASAGAVNRTITTLQRVFLLRNCSDGVFNNRTRPCLQYQIKRCSAPCVGKISKDDYAKVVGQSKQFLSGKSKEIQASFAKDMEIASQDMNFELAAELRDRIRAMAMVQSQQDINMKDVNDADVIAIDEKGGNSCIEVFFFRGGRNNGNHAYFPRHDKDQTEADIMASFIGQFYDSKPPPAQILVNIIPSEHKLLQNSLNIGARRKVEIIMPQRGDKRKVIDHAKRNASDALLRHMAEGVNQRKSLSGLAKLANITGKISRIEVYDNSHIQGTSAIGAMIVAGADGFIKKAYRKFNIKTAGSAVGQFGGDDYQMMIEVMTRRFSREIIENPTNINQTWPDLVIVDGGKGQMSVTMEVFKKLGIENKIALMGVAKGPERNAGRERIFIAGNPNAIMLDHRDPILYFIQRLRDEAHRFAINAHRTKRAKNTISSPLDDVPNIGAKRKKSLLLHFGSAKAVSRAGLADLEKVSGISKAVALIIYNFFR